MATRFTKIITALLITVFINTALYGDTVYLDVNFGINGIRNTIIGNSSVANSIVEQPDGKLVIAGQAFIDSSYQWLLARYNTDGSLDASFGTGGIVAFPFGSIDSLYNVIIDANDKIVATGSTYSDYSYMTLIRFNTDGSLDSSFGSGGIAIQLFGDGAAGTSSVIQPSNGYIITGCAAVLSGNPTLVVARFDTDGNLDTSFNSGGAVPGTVPTDTPFSATVKTIGLQSDEKIITAGFVVNNITGNYDVQLQRYNSDGTLDTSFGTSGIVRTDINSPYDFVRSITIQSNDYILITGYTQDGDGNNNILVVRYDQDGALDTAFGTGGIVTTLISNDTEGNDIAVQSDGKIIVVGQSDFNTTLVRYNGTDGSLDTTFGDGGVIVSGNTNDSEARSVNIATIAPFTDRITIAGIQGSNILLERYYPNNIATVFFTNPIDGSTINTNSATIYGTATRTGGTFTVRITVNTDDIFATVNLDAYGRWNAGTYPMFLSSTGGVSNSIRADLLESNSSIADTTITITDTAAYAVSIVTPANGATINNSTTAFTGRSSQASQTVKVSVDGSTPISYSTNNAGIWDAGTSPVLVNGSHTFQANLWVGGISVAGPATSTITVSRPDQVLITDPANGFSDTALPGTIVGSSTRNAAPLILFVDGAFFNSTTTTADGSWSINPAPTPAIGNHVLSADLTDSNGSVFADATNTFEIT